MITGTLNLDAPRDRMGSAWDFISPTMGARQKLNSAHVWAALIVATLIGLAFGSWVVLACLLVVLIGNALFSGGIRLKGGRR